MAGINIPSNFDPNRIKKPASSEELGPVRTKAADAPAIAGESAAAETTQTETKKRPDVHRLYNNSDIKNLLVKFNIPLKDPNPQIMTSIMEYGLAASGENFDEIIRLLKGRKDPKSIESAVVTLMKGLKSAPKTVDVLVNFLKGGLQHTGLLTSLNSQLTSFSKILKRSESLMSKGLHEGITSIIGELKSNISKLTKKNKEIDIELLRRKGVLTDIKTFFDFLGGVAKQVAGEDSSDIKKAFLNGIRDLKKDLEKSLSHLTSQAILSKDSMTQIIGQDDFAYWQLPNPMAQGPKSMELLISKKRKGSQSVIDPQKTRVILKFDTPDLGALAVELDVLDKQVWTKFFTQNNESHPFINKFSADLRDRLQSIDYEMVGFQVKNKPINIKKMLLPTYELDKMSHISTEI